MKRTFSAAVALPLLLAACARATPSVDPAELSSEAAEARSPSSAPAAAPAVASAPAVAGPSGSTVLPTAGGIDVGTPAMVHVGDRELPVVLVTNTSGAPRSFTVAAAWSKGGAVAATAQGSVFALQSRETRAVNLASQDGTATDDEQAEARVDRVLPLDQRQADVVGKIQFGRSSIQRGALSSLVVLVTNTDTAPHSLLLGGALLSKGAPVATASGSATLGPRLGLPINLALAGDDSTFDQVLAYVVAVVS